ncbi:MAG: hypothetical protein PVI40_02055 [Chlamydiota bacterium]|jgi:hypothetical protein
MTSAISSILINRAIGNEVDENALEEIDNDFNNSLDALDDEEMRVVFRVIIGEDVNQENNVNGRVVPRAISDNQRAWINRIINPQQSLQTYLRLNPVSALDVLRGHYGDITLFTVIGGTTGYIGSKILEKTQNLEIPQLIRMCFVVSGAIIGGLYRTHQINNNITNQIQLSTAYVDWKTNEIEEDVYQQYQEHLKENERLRDFLCPITHDLISFPVKTPDGRVWEKQNIQLHLELCRNAGITDERTHPFRIQPITIDDLTFDNEYHRIVVNVLNEIIAEETILSIREGIITFRDCVQQNFLGAVEDMRGILFRNENIENLIPNSTEEMRQAFLEAFGELNRRNEENA